MPAKDPTSAGPRLDAPIRPPVTQGGYPGAGARLNASGATPAPVPASGGVPEVEGMAWRPVSLVFGCTAGGR
nr:hypothetical protein GCM10020063_108440 [Dactylosporangium thailandense]